MKHFKKYAALLLALLLVLTVGCASGLSLAKYVMNIPVKTSLKLEIEMAKVIRSTFKPNGGSGGPSGSTITLDLIGPAMKGKMTEKKKMLVMRVMIAIFIVISAVIAIVQAKSKVVFIAQLMGVSWGALAGAFLAPFLYGLFHKKVSRASVYVSFVCGVAISLVQLVKSLTGFAFGVDFLDGVLFKTSLHSGVFAMLLGLVLVPLVSLLTRKSRPDGVEEMFSCYDEKVVSSAKKSLGE